MGISNCRRRGVLIVADQPASDDFVSVDTTQWKAPRKSDGSLPDVDYLKLVPGSDLRNAGVDVGLTYNGAAKDIGVFESVE